MIRCIITVQKVVSGTFNILFSFPQEVYLTTDDFRIDLIEGDPLGDPRDKLTGSGKHWMCQCYLPTGIHGKSRIVLDMRGFSARPVEIEYDSMRTITATWLEPVITDQKTELSISFSCPLQHLRKINFKFSKPVSFQLYRVGELYQLVLSKKIRRGFSVTVGGKVVKQNGLKAVIEDNVLEVV